MCFQQMVKSVFSDREREDPDHWKICQYNIVRYLTEVFLSHPTLIFHSLGFQKKPLKIADCALHPFTFSCVGCLIPKKR